MIDDADKPRTQTVAYGPAGMPSWIGPSPSRPAGAADLRPGESVDRSPPGSLLALAMCAADGHPLTTRDTRELGEAVVDLAGRLQTAMGAARRASQQALDAVDRAQDAATRAAVAEARLDLVMAARASAALDRSFDAACRSTAGRSQTQVIADLDWQVADHPDEDTVVVDPADHEVTMRMRPSRRVGPTDEDLDRIALVIRRVRDQRQPAAIVRLADLVEELLRCERAVHVAQRQPRGDVAYQLLEALDDAQVALGKAVRR